MIILLINKTLIENNKIKKTLFLIKFKKNFKILISSMKNKIKKHLIITDSYIINLISLNPNLFYLIIYLNQKKYSKFN